MIMKTGWLRALLAIGVLALIAIAAVTAYTVAGRDRLKLNGTAIDNPPGVQDVTLLGTDGETVQLGRWEGDLLLVFFGYAHCPDVCPLTMARLARTYEELGEPEDLQVLMVTVDPDRDTPEQLEKYVQRFHPDFVGLTGTPAMIADASARFYVASIGADTNPGGSVSHSSHVTLVDREGRMRLIYNQDKIGDLLKEDLGTLLAQQQGTRQQYLPGTPYARVHMP
ncbi:MAG: SCO family protein [Trueperaceae bacterium]